MLAKTFTEKDLDTVFIGRLDIHQIDDYGSIKAGTFGKTTIVRSKVDLESETITFITNIPERYGVSNIIMDGNVGLYGKIVERTQCYKKDELVSSDFLYIKWLTKDAIANRKNVTPDGIHIWETTAELDDIVFNGDNNYHYPVYFFGRGERYIYLSGMQITMPIKHFNHYIHMRNLWYRDYQGSTEIHKRDE